MNYSDTYFLVVYPGCSRIKASAFRIIDGNFASVCSKTKIINDNPSNTLGEILDEFEKELGHRFTKAHIAGFFGCNRSGVINIDEEFAITVKITKEDMEKFLFKNPKLQDPELQLMHLTPIEYNTDRANNMTNPIGTDASKLSAKFFGIFCRRKYISEITNMLKGAYLEPIQFVNIMFAMQNSIGKSLLISLGATSTRIAVSNDNSIVYMKDLDIGQNYLTKILSERFDLSLAAAEDLKTTLANALPKAKDQFESIGKIRVSDVKSEMFEFLNEIARRISINLAENYANVIPDKVIVFGGGANIEGVKYIFENALEKDIILPKEIKGEDIACQFTASHIIKQHRQEISDFQNKWWRRLIRKIVIKTTNKKCPVLPSSLAFPKITWEKLQEIENAGFTHIHYDYMDGKFTENKAGSVAEAAYIISKSNLKISVHLMVENPNVLIGKFAKIGASTITLSNGTQNLAKNLALIKQFGKKCGVAIAPEDKIEDILPIIKHLDEITVMSVKPGASGQKFMPSSLGKTKLLKAIRKKYKLKFKIVIDGGINDKNAGLCWASGADGLVSGNFIAKSKNLRLALKSLLPGK